MGAVTLRTQPLNRKLNVTRPTQLCAGRRQMGKEPLALTSFSLSHWSPPATRLYKIPPKSADLREVSQQETEVEGEQRAQRPAKPQ